MIHQELRLVGSIIFWTSVVAAVLSVVASLLTSTGELLYGVLAVGTGYLWRVWFHSHAQRGEDIQEMLQLLRNEEKRKQTLERQQRQQAIPIPPVQAATPSNTATREPAEGQDYSPTGETSILRDSLSRNKGTCAACGKHLLLVRVGDTCANCGERFTSEIHHRQHKQN